MEAFQEIVWDYYRHYQRDMPWRREPFDPYRILVSEMMLQQTQVSRVIPKYEAFLKYFPNIGVLARAPLHDVLAHWSGLGYNRRAKYLHESAIILAEKKQWTVDDLVTCKGIGENTAAAVIVYAYNQPLVFIETNIRTVFIHHFFPNVEDVADKDLLPFIERAVDLEHPREWYWALMDYGSHLKKHSENSSRRSKHYVKQSTFEGSNRQLRGGILKLLVRQPMTQAELLLHINDDRMHDRLGDLVHEGLIDFDGTRYRLSE